MKTGDIIQGKRGFILSPRPEFAQGTGFGGFLLLRGIEERGRGGTKRAPHNPTGKKNDHPNSFCKEKKRSH